MQDKKLLRYFNIKHYLGILIHGDSGVSITTLVILFLLSSK